MREINLTSKQIKVLTQRHKICREQKECDRIKAILLRNKDWSLAKIAEAYTENHIGHRAGSTMTTSLNP